jgi:hypothetical protein
MQAEHRHAKIIGAHGFPHPNILALSSTACPNEKTAIRPKIMSHKGLLAPEGVVATDMTAIHGLNAL